MRKLKYLIEEIKIQYCYPRLDVNVTKGFNHLLKSPFSIHPKTGKVSIVFKPANARMMKLEEVPTIYSLLDDSAENSAQHQNNMKNSVKNFQEVVFSIEKAEAMRRKNDASKYIPQVYLERCNTPYSLYLSIPSMSPIFNTKVWVDKMTTICNLISPKRLSRFD